MSMHGDNSDDDMMEVTSKETLEDSDELEIVKETQARIRKKKGKASEASEGDWWSAQRKTYPIFMKMARDILAILVSTVASEFAFSTVARVLDLFCTSLTHRMVEALICSQDWMRTSTEPFVIEENFLELEVIEEGMGELVLEQPSILIDESIAFPKNMMDFEPPCI